jgi:hypothetical protein
LSPKGKKLHFSLPSPFSFLPFIIQMNVFRPFVLASLLNFLTVCGFHNTATTPKGAPLIQQHHKSILRTSDNDNDKTNQIDVELDPDATPLFEQEPPTLFGLEPKSELSPLDNGLTFTGPLILFASMYLIVSVWFGDDVYVPPLDSF